MIRKTLTLMLGWSSLLAAVTQVSAQAVVPEFPQFPRILVPKIDGLPPELQREFDRMQEELDQAFNQAFPQANRRTPVVSTMTWGGMQLKKVAADEQEKLGLPENEGLIVAAVPANSDASKAGLKAKDVLVKINQSAVPNDQAAFAKLVKDQKAAEPIDLVVLRDGKEETIKGAKLPAVVQMPSARPLPAFGGGLPFRAMPLAIPGGQFNGRIPFQNGLFGAPGNVDVNMMINGAKISKKQNGENFTGEYSKGDLRISVAGKLENGMPKTSEITIHQGKDTNKYKAISEVPAQHRAMVQQLMPTTLNSFLLPLQQLQDLQNFPGLPLFPEFDK